MSVRKETDHSYGICQRLLHLLTIVSIKIQSTCVPRTANYTLARVPGLIAHFYLVMEQPPQTQQVATFSIYRPVRACTAPTIN
jgi:hypothetical protein